MAKVEVELTPKTIKALEEVVEDFNAATGQTLDLEGWIVFTLGERAIAAELGAYAETAKREVDQEVVRKIGTRRRQLMESLHAV